MDKPHKQVVTTYPVAIRKGQGQVHVLNERPFHAFSQTIKCPTCAAEFIVASDSKDFSPADFLTALAKHHTAQQGQHLYYIASAPEWTSIADCDCQG